MAKLSKKRFFIVPLVSACLSATLAAQEFEYSVDAEYGIQFDYTVAPNRSYHITMNTSDPQNCAELAEKSCCGILASTTGGDVVQGDYDYIAASSTSQVSMIMQSGSNSTMQLFVYGFGACEFDAPVLSNNGSIIESRATGQATGQLGNSYTLSTTKIGNDGYVMHDTSRHADNGGAMPKTSAIRSESVFAHSDAIGIYLTDPGIDSDNTWDRRIQQELADANANSALVYDFLQDVLGINSFDDQGGQMISHVNAYYPQETANFCGYSVPPGTLFNAFWNGYNITFTKRDMTGFFDNTYYDISLAAALDVAAHEWGHGVSDRAVNLAYERESGALNEAFSDWIGVAVEHYAGETNWTMGEGVDLIRDLKNPKDHRQPDTYQGEHWYPTSQAECPTPDICENDYCGVHINSGVANKMFYLLSEGGTHNDVTVEGIGINTAINIAYDAIRFHWSSNEDFAGAREGMVAAAESYGDNAALQVGMAWAAVGVGDVPSTASSGSSQSSTRSSTSSSSSSGGGGCSVATGPSKDAGLLLLLLLLVARVARAKLH